MKLSRVHIKEFKSITDSGEFEIGDITCLVGKNEAGKTAILQALYKLNPIISAEGNYSVTDDYPRKDVEDYRVSVDSNQRQPATVASAVFEFETEDIQAVTDQFGPQALVSNTLRFRKGYENKESYDVSVNEQAVLRFLVEKKPLTPELSGKLIGVETPAQMQEVLKDAEQTESVQALATTLSAIQKNGNVTCHVYETTLRQRIPKFLYFDEYYQMEGRANIESLKQRKGQNNLKKSDHPLLGLINLARLDLDQLINPSRTRELKNKLEGASNHLTKNVIKYWSQNKYLHLRFDVRPARPNDPPEMVTGTNIWGDVYDSKHFVTTELGSRSRGFIWFFSFLAWYSDIKKKNEKVILLLDEPGLSLHAKAQEDLLDYFEAEINGTHQLIYSTHSPFMVKPSRFDRVRIVQDLGIELEEGKELPADKEGTKVITDVLDATKDSLFPLQGALGYEIYQTLFIGPNSIVVEGVSDLLFLQSLSGILQSLGRTGLDPRWIITPVGGSDKVPTFVALIGAQKKLNVAVLIDYQKKDKQIIENLYKKRLLEKRKVSTFADFISMDEADIEDIFDIGDYLGLLNAEYVHDLIKPISNADLSSHKQRITVRLEEYFKSNPLNEGISFNHYRPARYFAENTNILKSKLSKQTLERFESIFKHLNKLL